MAYVPVPKDLSKIKPKFAFNLTLRQLVCLGGGALVGVPLYFYLKPHTGSSFAAFCMIAILVPAFLIGLFEYQGQPLEKVLSQVNTAYRYTCLAKHRSTICHVLFVCPKKYRERKLK